MPVSTHFFNLHLPFLCFLSSIFDRQAETPQGTLITALLLSLGGVSCFVFNQWHSSFHQNIQQMEKVLDSRCFIKNANIQNKPDFVSLYDVIFIFIILSLFF